LIKQANLDNEVSGLFDTVKAVYQFLTEDDTIQNINSMRDILGNIARVISVVAQFIKNYAETKSFWERLRKNVLHETQVIIDGYTKELNDLMQQYRDRAIRDIHVNIHRALDDLNLEGMACAGGASLNRSKKCLDGTRIEVLTEIVSWIHDTDENVSRILWLRGQAGRGKSAIAHTIALWLKNAGGLGSCFCFARDRQAEHREEKIFITIARDLADRDRTFRRALADVIAEDHTLKTTPDITLQWEKLILEPLSKVSSSMIGSIVVVIDALDESGSEGSRRDILSVLASQASNLPRNFRVFVTSRPLPDIERVLSAAPHVKATSLDNVSTEWTERDIHLYISKQLGHLPDIGDTEVQRLVQKADCLFEWARLACDFIKPNRAGATVKERYDDVISFQAEEGGTLLDATYLAILEIAVPRSRRALERYRSVMHQVVMTLEPLPMAALDCMRKHFPNEQDHYDVFLILEFLSPVLGGIIDRPSAVRPLHASFYDFLTDRSRSGVFFIDTTCTYDLAIATLKILQNELRFNICELESSYLSNARIADLPARINKKILPHLSYSCQFWSQHLLRTTFDSALAVSMHALVGNERILFWLEVMSLMGEVGNAVIALKSAAKWFLVNTLALVDDAIRFIHSCSGAISHSAPHIYISALAFIPVKTRLSMMLMPKFSSLPGITGGPQYWSAMLLALEGHTASVYSVAFSPDGKRIVSGSADRTVRVWDAERGFQIGSHLEGHTDWVLSVGFSPDGKRIVSGSWDKTVRVWNTERGFWIGNHFEGHTGEVLSVAFSPDGKKIVSGSADNTVRIWDAERGVQIGNHLEGHTCSVESVAFSPDGKKIVSGSWDKTVRIWDPERGIQIGSYLEGHIALISSVAWSPDGKRIATASNGVMVLKAESGMHISSYTNGHVFGFRAVAFSPEGKRIVSGSADGIVTVWDTDRSMQIGCHLEGHIDVTVRVWDAERSVQIGSQLEGHIKGVYSVAFSPDSKRIVSCSQDRTVRVWDAERGRAVSGSDDNNVSTWGIRHFHLGSHLGGDIARIHSFALSPDSKRVVTGSEDNIVRIWDAERDVQIGSNLEGHGDEVISVAFSPDGKRILSGSLDGTLRVWDAEKGSQIGSQLEGHRLGVCSVAFSPDGKRIVSGSFDKTVRVWDGERGLQIGGCLEGHTKGVTSVAFSQDGKRIVSGSDDNTVRVWDAEGYEDIHNIHQNLLKISASKLSDAHVLSQVADGK
ncbi:hypothetical protein PISMIDRAFT_646831, partial [Pisolithus microcarpus 441]